MDHAAGGPWWCARGTHRPLLGQPPARLRADPTGTPGHERHMPGQAIGHRHCNISGALTQRLGARANYNTLDLFWSTRRAVMVHVDYGFLAHKHLFYTSLFRLDVFYECLFLS